VYTAVLYIETRKLAQFI